MIYKRKKICVLFIAVILISVLISGCGCKHQWQDASCYAPRTCSLCGETEGKPRAHKWGNTACHEPEGCVYCGTLDGIELSHEWQEDCRICIHCAFDGRPAEDRFPDVLAEGLEERWQLESEMLSRQASEGSEVYVLTRTDWEELFNTEYIRIEPFKEEKFEDEAMGKLAMRYIRSIEASIAALEHLGTERWEDEYNNDAYWEQANVLYLINSQREISVSEQYRERLEKTLANGEIIDMVHGLIDQVMFLHVDSNYMGEKYETTVKNTSTLSFDWFSFDVNLLNDAGEVVDTVNIKVEDWEPEEKLRFNFTSKQEFSGIEVAFANWQMYA